MYNMKRIYSTPMTSECVGRIRMSILAGSTAPDPNEAKIKVTLDDQANWEDNGARKRRNTLNF